MKQYLIGYIIEDHGAGYDYYGSEIVYNVAEWAIDVQALKRLKNQTCTCLSVIEMTEEQAQKWLAK